jgi:glycosyltransferase involved in cell wall biosynthesis
VPVSREALTAVVTTYNEEVNLPECLNSLTFADETLVVDSFSTDRTVEIARSFPRVRVLQHEYFGSAAQKNWAMDRVTTPWLLIVDADEMVTPELALEISNLLKTGPRADHYRIRRENIFLGEVIRHSGWSTDRVVRLVRRGSVRYPNRRVHADLQPGGPTLTLSHSMLHNTCRSLDQYLEKVHRYAVWGAADAFRGGRQPGFVELLVRPAWRFVRTYVVQAGFLDGGRGLLVCGLQAYGVFLKWSQVWEWQQRRRDGLPTELPAFDESPETWQA